jgi:hypothetical protein
MSFTAYSHSLCHKQHEASKLNYYTFSDELIPLGINSLSSPSKWMLGTKIDHSRWKTLNSESDFTEWVTALWKSRWAEVQKLVWPPDPRGWLRSVRKKGGPPTTRICIDICCQKWFYSFKCFFYWKFRFRGPTFFVARCTSSLYFFSSLGRPAGPDHSCWEQVSLHRTPPTIGSSVKLNQTLPTHRWVGC